jgi:hypothetical protein
VIYRPDYFQGAHAYQHLPGVLRGYGYTAGDFTLREHADPRDLNLREGFHRSMDEDLEGERLLQPAWLQRALPITSTFSNASYERLGGRVMHAFGMRELQNAHEEVTGIWSWSGSKDWKRIESLKDFVRTAERPFFAHTHLLGTHGPIFSAKDRIFSSPESAAEIWQRPDRPNRPMNTAALPLSYSAGYPETLLF